jgi:hypothetical protein
MWTTLFPLALAACVWFSAVNLAVQLDKGRAAMSAASQPTSGEVISMQDGAAGARLD